MNLFLNNCSLSLFVVCYKKRYICYKDFFLLFFICGPLLLNSSPNLAHISDQTRLISALKEVEILADIEEG